MDDIETLQALVQDDPDDYFTRFCLGKALLDAAHPQDAVPHLQATIRLNPDYPVAHRYLGAAFEQLHRRDEALQVWRDGMAVSERTGLFQTGKEMAVFVRRLEAS